jgi:hypothetical protein
MTVGLGARSVVVEVAVRGDMKKVKRRILIRLLSAISRVRSEEYMEYNLSRASIDSSDRSPCSWSGGPITTLSTGG